jgi:diguanylate cyclase (GGDEF)-like protein
MHLHLPYQDGVLPPITVSIGVAVAAVGETDAATLLSRADAALYEAKTQGRNRVVIAEPA